MIAVYLWIMLGFIDLIIGLYHSFHLGWDKQAEHMIKNILIIFALLEFIRVLQAYLLLGRVRVTFIIDVTLVVLIGEMLGYWYRQIVVNEIILGIAVICILVVLRIVTSKYSPESNEG